jgi:hypothetical protein
MRAFVSVGIRQHPAMFSASLCEKVILTFSKEDRRVGNMFCGSGQTLIAAQRWGGVGRIGGDAARFSLTVCEKLQELLLR